MREGSYRSLKSGGKNFVKFFGEERVVGVEEASERLSGVVRGLLRWHRAIVVRDVLALVFPAGKEWRVEDGSGLRD